MDTWEEGASVVYLDEIRGTGGGEKLESMTLDTPEGIAEEVSAKLSTGEISVEVSLEEASDVSIHELLLQGLVSLT